MSRAYDLIAATSMGVRITPMNRQPVGTGSGYVMQATSAESNVLNVSASLGLRTRALTAFVEGSPIAAFIKGELRRRGILIRHFNTPLLHNYIRVSVGRPEHTDALVAALNDILLK